MLRVKAGVTPKSLVICAAAANSAQELNATVVVTSGSDGKHKEQSKHYTHEALDLRTKNLSVSDRDALLVALRRRLGNSYDVVLEEDHIHVEYDP